jgi:hypothetical protein
MNSRGVDNGWPDQSVPGSEGIEPPLRDPLAGTNADGPIIVVTDASTSDPLREFASEQPSVAPAARAEPLAHELERTPRYEPPPPDVHFDLPLMSAPPAYRAETATSSRASRLWAVVGLIGVAVATVYLAQTYQLGRHDRSPAASSTGVRSESTILPGIETERREAQNSTEITVPRTETPKIRATRQPAPGDSGVVETSTNHEDSPSLTGEWSMNTRVESSRLGRYEGLRLVYHLSLQQVGNRVTGIGYKLRENEKTVRTQTPIALVGEVDGDRVVMTFTERGTRRASAGKLVFDRESDDLLRGRFSSDAALSTGVAEARR